MRSLWRTSPLRPCGARSVDALGGFRPCLASRWPGRGALLACALVLACAPPGPSPRDVAKTFWGAVRAGDLPGAEAVAAGDPRGLASLIETITIEGVMFAEPVDGDGLAAVDTSIVPSDGGAPLRFQTHLVWEDEAWRVQVPRTRQSLTQAILTAGADQLRAMIERGVAELSEVIQEGALEAAEALRQTIDDLENDALLTPPPAPPPGAQTPGSGTTPH